ncbi:hypothetical protein T10_3288 [Trichinella papuae]|uniref:Uncharacterized protein n=1 Tax=Trichinella papuae TaxID=268474 RepID=A0A0V1N6H0_9BILA|nr:hypothetical protein T10_3288 [Trichinella papuae]
MKKFHSNPANPQPHIAFVAQYKCKHFAWSKPDRRRRRCSLAQQSSFDVVALPQDHHGRGSFPDFDIGTGNGNGANYRMLTSTHLDVISCTEMSTTSGNFSSVERLVNVAVLLSTFYRIIACSLDEQNIYVLIHPLGIVYLASWSNHILGYCNCVQLQST